MRRALYIGRFQLFHLGHLDVIRQIDAAADIDEIVVAVGSSQYDHRCKSPAAPWSVNPFTYEERHETIARSLVGEVGKPWSIHPLPDYHDWERWYRHIEEQLPAIACLYSADEEERGYFTARGKEVRCFERRFPFHAGMLRAQMARGDDGYRDCLPAGTLAVLDRIGAVERVRDLYCRDRAACQHPGAGGAPS